MYGFYSATIVVTLQIVFLSKVFAVPVPYSIRLSNEKIEFLQKICEIYNETLAVDIDPCVNFHGHVCAKSRVNSVNISSMDSVELFKALEDYFLKTEKLTSAEVKLRNYLTSCKYSSEEEIRQIVEDFSFPKSIGGWPAFNSTWKEDKFDLQYAIAELQTYDISVIIDQFFVLDRSTFMKYLSVRPKDFELLWDDERKGQLKFKLLQLGVPNIYKLISDAVELEKEILDALYGVQWEYAYDIETNFAGLKQEIPEIDWDRQVEISVGKKLDEDFPVVIRSGEVLRTIINTVSKMNPEFVANYFFCNYVLYMPVVKNSETNRTCISYATEYFEPVITEILLKKYRTNDSEAKLIEMIELPMNSVNNFLNIYNTSIGSLPEFLKKILGGGEYSTNHFPQWGYEQIEIDSSNFIRNTYRLKPLKRAKTIGICSDGDEVFCKIELLCYLLLETYSVSLYKIEHQPSTLAYLSTSVDLIYAILSETIEPNDIDNSVSECYNRQLPTVDISRDALLGLLTSQIYNGGYFDYTKRNNDIIQAENSVLRQCGFSVEKLYFTLLMKEACSEDEINIIKQIQLIFMNSKEFSDIYNCPLRTPMNPEEKCQIKTSDFVISSSR